MLFDRGKSREAENAPHLEHGTPFKKRLGWWVKSGKQETVTLDVTPQMAAEMLTYNDRNRPLSKSRLKRYVADMKAGRWVFNGDTITFSSERLIDGQTRLSAIVQSGVTLKMIVVFGAPDHAFAFKDLPGSVRTAADIFAINGVSNASMMASATCIVMHYDANTMRSGLAGVKPAHDQLYDAFTKHPSLPKSAHYGHLFAVNRGVASPSLMAALHYICARHSRVAADAFFTALADGANLKKSDACYKLRKRLVEANLASATRLSRVAVAALIIKAWNAMREGRGQVLLRWNEDESFPKAH